MQNASIGFQSKCYIGYCNITEHTMPDLFGRSKLKEELDAWQKYSDSLLPDDRAALERTIQNAMQYGEFVEDAPRGHETEAFLLSILLSQQKKIEELKRAFANQKKDWANR